MLTNTQRTLLYSTNPFTALECPKPSFILRHPNSTATDIIANGLPEKSLIDWCQQFCSKEKTFVDIGAHVGMYSLSLAPYCQTVHSFECQRETYFQLCGGVALNAQWNVHPHHVALGKSNELEVPIYIVSSDGGGTTTNIENVRQTNQNDTLYDIASSEQRTLDSYQLKNISFLKIDAEGAEEDILRGAVETLKDSKYPPFIFESWTEERFAEKRTSLENFITRELGYCIRPLNNYPHMKFAHHL